MLVFESLKRLRTVLGGGRNNEGAVGETLNWANGQWNYGSWRRTTCASTSGASALLSPGFLLFGTDNNDAGLRSGVVLTRRNEPVSLLGRANRCLVFTFRWVLKLLVPIYSSYIDGLRMFANSDPPVPDVLDVLKGVSLMHRKIHKNGELVHFHLGYKSCGPTGFINLTIDIIFWQLN